MNPPPLTLQELHKRFGAVAVLDGIDLQLQPGETLGLIGPNGAGKTTLINLISGFMQPDRGDILLGSRPLTGLAPARRARLGLARCFQSSHVFPRHSLRDNLALALRARSGGYALLRRQPLSRSRERADELLAQTLFKGRGQWPAQQLSYGERRLLDLLITLAPQPPVLLLDEPTAGLAPAEAEQAMQLVHTLCPASSTLLVSHDLDLVFAHCDRIAVLSQGLLVALGSVNAIRRDAAAQRAYLGEVAA